MLKQLIVLRGKSTLLAGVFLILLLDCFFSIRNFYNTTLDGDLALIVAPSGDYQSVLMNPLGVGVWKDGHATAATNRFAAHYGFGLWMNNVPRLLPSGGVDALYSTVAILKGLTHFGLMLLLLYVLLRITPITTAEKGLTLLIISSLFQDSGAMALFFSVINTSITYTFFYSTQIFLLGLFLSLLFLSENVSVLMVVLVLLGTPILALGGPLNAPVMGIGGLIFLLYRKLLSGLKENKFDLKDMIVVYIFMWAAYSFWLGQFNTEHSWASLPLSERFVRMGQGIMIMIEPWRGAWFFLSPVIAFNLTVIFKSNKNKRMMGLYLVLGLFVLMWLFLLPLGGYREYRPYILRGDTLLPVNLILIWVFAHSSVLVSREKTYLIIPALLCSLYFLSLDWKTKVSNKLERAQFARLIDSKEACVALPRSGTLMHWEWNYISNCDYSRPNLIYLNRIGVVRGNHLYHYMSAPSPVGIGAYVSIISKHSGKCLDVRSADEGDGADVIQSVCYGEDGQLHQLVDKGNGYYSLVSKHGNQCLTVSGVSKDAGQKIVHLPCQDGDNQLIALDDMSGGYYSLRYKHSGKCIDVFGGRADVGANLIQWPCHGGDNQLFRFEPR